MSRFATPSRERPVVVANPPSIPVQREPGFRYGNGQALPGASFKGRHVVEVIVGGIKIHSPTNSRPNSPLRGVSPGGTIRDFQSTHDLRSMADSQALPKSSTKPFVKPERSQRTYTRYNSSTNVFSPAVQQQNMLTAGRSINISGSNVNSRSGTPTRRLSRDFSVNSEVISLARPQSAQSVRSSSNKSVSSSVSSMTGLSYGASVRSLSAGRNLRAMSPVQYLSGGQHSSLSNANAPIHQSLSSPRHHNSNNISSNNTQASANKLELSQSAYRSFRKACVRDAIHQFLQSEEVHREQVEDEAVLDNAGVDESLHDLLDLSIAGGAAGVLGHDEQGDNNRHMSSSRTMATSKMAMGKEDRKKFRRLYKMINLLRQSIVDDLNLQSMNQNNGSVSQQQQPLLPETLFFPSQHMQAVVVSNSRANLLQLVIDWRQQYSQTALGALDKYYATWITARSQRLQAQRSYQEILLQYRARSRQKEQLKQQIRELQQQANSLNLTLPRAWFPADLQIEYLPSPSTALTRSGSQQQIMGTTTSGSSAVGYFTSGLDQQGFSTGTGSVGGGSNYDASQSVFLSPQKFLQASKQQLVHQLVQQQQQQQQLPVRPASIVGDQYPAQKESEAGAFVPQEPDLQQHSDVPQRQSSQQFDTSTNGFEPSPSGNDYSNTQSISSMVLDTGGFGVNLDVVRALAQDAQSAPTTPSANAAPQTSPLTAVRQRLSAQHQPNFHTLVHSPIFAHQGASALIQHIPTAAPAAPVILPGNASAPFSYPAYTQQAGQLQQQQQFQKQLFIQQQIQQQMQQAPPPPPPPFESNSSSPSSFTGAKHLPHTNSNSSLMSSLSSPMHTPIQHHQKRFGGSVGNLAMSPNANVNLSATKDPRLRARYVDHLKNTV